MTDYDIQKLKERNSIFCPRAKEEVSLSQSRAECAKKHGCVGSCLLNVEFYLKATLRYLGLCK